MSIVQITFPSGFNSSIQVGDIGYYVPVQTAGLDRDWETLYYHLL